MTLRDSRYVVVKPIPLDREGEKTIKVGTMISVTHGCVYMNGGFIEPEYQDDFRMLIADELERGFKYLRPDNPVVGKSIIGGKGDL